jgi:hypothetical protein
MTLLEDKRQSEQIYKRKPLMMKRVLNNNMHPPCQPAAALPLVDKQVLDCPVSPTTRNGRMVSGWSRTPRSILLWFLAPRGHQFDPPRGHPK